MENHGGGCGGGWLTCKCSTDDIHTFSLLFENKEQDNIENEDNVI